MPDALSPPPPPSAVPLPRFAGEDQRSCQLRRWFLPCEAGEGNRRRRWRGRRSFAWRGAGALLVLAGLCTIPAHAAETVLTPTRVIYPGETVSADAVAEVRVRAVSASAGPVATDLSQVNGRVAKRTLVPGKLIPVSALRQAYVVEQGKPVEAVYSFNNLSISLTAVALQSGAVGDFVRLRNPDSGKTFSGTVLANGTVAVGGS